MSSTNKSNPLKIAVGVNTSFEQFRSEKSAARTPSSKNSAFQHILINTNFIVVPRKFCVGQKFDALLVGAKELLGSSDARLGVPVGISDGVLLSRNVGGSDGYDEGFLLGLVLGPSDGTAIAQVLQHMDKTVSNEHLYVEFVFAAHAQSCLAPPSSGTSKVDVPAASPVQEVQQLSQQLTATSGSAHLNFVR